MTKAKMKIYISGPMTGIKDFNKPAFVQAKNIILESGNIPISPVDIGALLELNMQSVPSWQDYMREDIKAMMHADGILALSGWENSKGATEEIRIAQSLGIPIYYDISKLKNAKHP